MSEVIVDTNVAMVANGQHGSVVQSCADACVEFLTEAHARGIVVIDDGDEVLLEYMKALKIGRPQQIGAQFLILIQQHQYNPERVRRVALAKTPEGGFVDFPKVAALAKFDNDDLKFATLSAKTGVAVTAAVDRGWAIHHAALTSNGILVDFLCGSDRKKWFKT